MDYNPTSNSPLGTPESGAESGNMQIGNIDWQQCRLETFKLIEYKKVHWKHKKEIGNKNCILQAVNCG